MAGACCRQSVPSPEALRRSARLPGSVRIALWYGGTYAFVEPYLGGFTIYVQFFLFFLRQHDGEQGTRLVHHRNNNRVRICYTGVTEEQKLPAERVPGFAAVLSCRLSVGRLVYARFREENNNKTTVGRVSLQNK